MKKRVMGLILSAVFCLCACGGQEQQKDTEQNQQEAAEEVQETSSYTVNLVQGTKTEDGNFDVVYPQLEGWENTEAQERWNQEFQTAELQDGVEGSQIEDYESYTVKPRIMTQTEDLLSILMEGTYFFKGAAHPYAFAYTYNIDMKTGESYRLPEQSEELVNRISAELLAGNYTIESEFKEISISDVFWVDEGDTLDESRIFNELQSCDYDPEFIPTCYSYWREDKIGIVFSTNHALGDYVIFEVNQ